MMQKGKYHTIAVQKINVPTSNTDQDNASLFKDYIINEIKISYFI